MKQSEKTANAERFAERLRSLMVEKGHTSPGSRSGVDVSALARAAATSYEMARRYAEGSAMPRPDKLEAIAAWLGVSPSELAFGAPSGSAAINEERLRQCIEAVLEAQRRTGRALSTGKAAHLAAVLYSELGSGALPSVEAVDLLVRAAT